MSIKVIGGGFGRTGTLSLKHALEILGFGPCYHMTEIIDQPKNSSHVQLWTTAAMGRQIDYASMLSEYQAIVDWPGSHFYKEMMLAFPDAKVVLTKRSFESWYQSVSSTIHQVLRTNLPWLAPPGMKNMSKMINGVVWEGTFHGRFEDPEYARQIYDDHIAEVIRSVPADRLLVFEVSEGWEPLCRFLGVPVPAQPFPRVNDTQDFQKRIKTLKLVLAIIRLAGYLLILLGVVLFFYIFSLL